MNDATHFLSRNCFVCRIESYWIVLNATGDKYLCVPHAALSCVGDRLNGWKDAHSSPVASTEGEREALIASLTRSGIITRDSLSGKSFAESKCPAPERQFESLETTISAALRCLWIARCLMACAIADWRLRTSSLSSTLSRIERRRIRAEYSAVEYDAAYTSRLVGAFKKFRPLYPRPYLCLFDSMALLEFLARYRFFPRIVFGVVADPFEAHCWLQEGTTVINDDLERVAMYKPIMSL